MGKGHAYYLPESKHRTNTLVSPTPAYQRTQYNISARWSRTRQCLFAIFSSSRFFKRANISSYIRETIRANGFMKHLNNQHCRYVETGLVNQDRADAIERMTNNSSHTYLATPASHLPSLKLGLSRRQFCHSKYA
jgi:hypothetical protein